ncbi:hypothetical protein GCM10027346_22010 [Hymenobacter seoulensis]
MAASAPNNTPNTPDQRPTGDLEHLFRQKFAEAEVTPRASFWDQLDHELVVQQNEQVVQENVVFRRRLVVHRWVAAACLLLALGFGGWALLWQTGQTFGPELATTSPATSAEGGANGTAQLPQAGAVASASGSEGSRGAGADFLAAYDQATSGATGSGATSDAALADRFNNAVASSASPASSGGVAGLLGSLYSASDSEAASSRSAGSYSNGLAALFASGSGSGNEGFQGGYGSVENRTAQLRRLLGSLARPDTLKPSLLAAPQLAAASKELAAVEPERKETPKLWRRLRLGGGYAVGSYNPNINFSHTDGRLAADPVTNALRNYYQDDAENEYRRNLRAGVSQRVALKASYALNDRWTLLSGAEVADQRATSATTYGFVDGKQVGREAADLFSRPAVAMSYSPQPRTTSYRYRTASVPVEVRYGSTKPGVTLYAKVGAAVGLLLNSRSELEGSPEATRTYTLRSAESPYRHVLTSVRGGAGVRYQPAAAAWNLVVGPVAEAGLTTLNAHPSQRPMNQSRPYSLSLEASVEFGSVKPQPVAQ